MSQEDRELQAAYRQRTQLESKIKRLEARQQKADIHRFARQFLGETTQAALLNANHCGEDAQPYYIRVAQVQPDTTGPMGGISHQIAGQIAHAYDGDGNLIPTDRRLWLPFAINVYSDESMVQPQTPYYPRGRGQTDPHDWALEY